MVTRRVCLLGLGSLAVSSGLTGCFPLAATGMVVGALSISDRRTTGAQAEDQAIELKGFNRLRERFKGDSAITASVTSFNRTALITGFVPDQTTKAEVGQIVGRIENVRTVINELIVGLPASVTTYGRDVLLTTRVKATLLDARDLNGNLIKVVTESSTVYLMGVVSPREASRASEIVSRGPGVRRVVQAFEVITEEQARAIDTALQGGKAAPEVQGKPSTQPVPPPAGAPQVMPVR
jgi:osmotically-inducible protein OsmY